MTAPALQDADLLLAQDMGERFYSDPLGFVMYAFKWGEGVLEGFDGPVDWQSVFLRDLGDAIKERNFNRIQAVAPIRMCVASGHGIGKTALTAWIMLFLMSTRPLCRGVVTANTGNQLSGKTWSELSRWASRCVNSHWFEVRTGLGSLRIGHKDHPSTWFVEGVTCREENSESFAGLHSAQSTPFYIFDEASAIPEKIWEVASGGLTDGEPMFFAFGNPTRNTGSFRECFGRAAHRWDTRQIDSRDVELTNKTLLDEWVDDHGEDSDFVRVRVRGVFPKAGDLQFIPSDAVTAAMRRDGTQLPGEPLLLGIDLARGGSDKTVLMFRSGRCAKPGTVPIPDPIILSGEESRDSMKVVSLIAQAMDDHRPDATFLDATGGSVGGPMADRLKQLGYNVTHIGFSEACPDPKWKCANMRSYMWTRMRQWLVEQPGGSLWDNPDLEAELTSPEFSHNSRDELLLESKEHMKKRGLASPDLADALALTFAMPVHPKIGLRRKRTRKTAIM